ncbi:hypothetical protein K488DRAFT_86332 [Vararia minispora EC-137]|uniref:Uncharacterized protein n=1 Tax=Vararia minispora EC-137 TaxID=1314806 RepID=A0ACB8QJX3_9AGAM|nr:hypothetical protein K488DRAFT_86332 [Vararia minispora EC-137]
MLSSPTPFPRTPTSSRAYHPHASSPLSASASSPLSSPSSQIGIRRSQYKSTTPAVPSSSRRSSATYAKRPHNVSSTPAWDGSFMRGNLFATEPEEDPARRSLLRERFKQRCFERAQRAREVKIRSGRKHAHYSSDGEDLDMEDEEDVDEFLNDEFFARVMQSAKRNQQHQYRLSYQLDVGSSFDPDMEDVGQWERDLEEPSDGPRPPSEYDEDDPEELAKLAEDEAYWDELGDTSFLDALEAPERIVEAPAPEEGMDLS